jgi:hypothetical protein
MDEFRDAIARITIEGTKIRGTGFLVAPNLVATALHVVADRKTEPPTFFPGTIHLEFSGHTIDAEVMPEKWNQDADCVLLRCLNPVPLAEYPTIPLRELNKSDDLWKTRGYPDAQWVDGTTWDGDITSYTALLTNSYEKRKVPYQPVLQLFCKQAGAGDGAPPRGLSGAPVVVGTAAVGLLRFALMQNGHATAGTLYACNAKDIVALYPEKLGLRPPLATVTILNEQEAEKLIKILVDAFEENSDDLRRLIKFSLGMTLESSKTPGKELGQIISSLLLTLVQRGSGSVDMLLRAAVTVRPKNENLLRFTRQHFPLALQPLDDDALVLAIQRALMELASMKQAAEVQQVIGGYRSAFEVTKRQIDTLAKYKELHNCLHLIQKSLLAITTDIGYLKKGNVSVRILQDHAFNLRGWANTARNQISRLATEEDERVWIDELDACAADIETNTIPAAPALDREKVLTVPDRLSDLLVNSPRINTYLYAAAQAVQLDNFADTMDSVVHLVGNNTASATSLSRLREGSSAVGMLCSRLAGMVAEHNEWQFLNTLLDGAKISPKHRAQAKIPSWKQFRTKLIGLCDVHPAEDWSKGLRAMMTPWLTDTVPAEPQIPGIIREIDDEFWRFQQAFLDRFFQADMELNALCAKVTQFATPLDALLNA